jgi:oxaloacetate decarboxylase gamma subunit
MTIVEMLEQSGVLTLLGMGVVFSFLVVLIICITLAGKCIHALGADKDVVPLTAAAPRVSGGGSNAGNGSAVTAAITAAVNEYRKTNA